MKSIMTEDAMKVAVQLVFNSLDAGDAMCTSLYQGGYNFNTMWQVGGNCMYVSSNDPDCDLTPYQGVDMHRLCYCNVPDV